MPRRVPCLDCPNVGRWPRGRCPDCTRTRDQGRGTTATRGYGATHQTSRAAWQSRMNAGETVWCHSPECLTPGAPVDPLDWQLGHDADRRERGPEHSGCNLAAAGRDRHRFGRAASD